MFASCATIKDVHYYKDKIEGNSLPNYYKVTITGYSLMSSSRYLSGYFDKSAVNFYFNETAQPNNAQFIKAVNTTETPGGTTEQKIASPFGETGDELVILFSTRAKAIANNISNFSNNQSILNSVYRLSQKEKLKDYNSLKSEISKNDRDNINYKILMDAIFSELENDNLKLKDKKELIKKLLTYQDLK